MNQTLQNQSLREHIINQGCKRMRFHDEGEAVTYIFRSMRKMRGEVRGLDEHTRDVGPTHRLVQAHNLLATQREYAVVTGSKGKGSTTVITSRLLQHLG